MKELVDFLNEKGVVLKSLKPIEPKLLNSRKRVEIYLGQTLQGYYAVVIAVHQKSRFLKKHAQETDVLAQRLQTYIDASIPNRYIVISSAICSKAKAWLEHAGWKVWGVQ